MGRNRFVTAEVDRVPLSDGDWIEVKRDLNTGDARKLEAAGLKPPVMVEGRIISPIDWAVYDLERAIIFLVDWSFKGPDDKPVTLNMDALRTLQPPDFDEINRAITKHTIERATAKKQLQGEKVPTPTTNSPLPESPETVDGQTSE